ESWTSSLHLSPPVPASNEQSFLSLHESLSRATRSSMMKGRRGRDFFQLVTGSCGGRIELISLGLVLLTLRATCDFLTAEVTEDHAEVAEDFSAFLRSKTSATSAVKLFSFPVGNSSRHLNFVPRINPGFGAASDVEQISKTGLLHQAGGGTGAKAARTDNRDRLRRPQIQLRKLLSQRRELRTDRARGMAALVLCRPAYIYDLQIRSRLNQFPQLVHADLWNKCEFEPRFVPGIHSPGAITFDTFQTNAR